MLLQRATYIPESHGLLVAAAAPGNATTPVDELVEEVSVGPFDEELPVTPPSPLMIRPPISAEEGEAEGRVEVLPPATRTVAPELSVERATTVVELPLPTVTLPPGVRMLVPIKKAELAPAV